MHFALSCLGGIAAGTLIAKLYVVYKERQYHKHFGV